MPLHLKKHLFKKNRNVLRFSKYVKKYIYRKKKYVTFTHESKRGGMATCIVIYLEPVFLNTYMHLKQCMSYFSNVQKFH